MKRLKNKKKGKKPLKQNTSRKLVLNSVGEFAPPSLRVPLVYTDLTTIQTQNGQSQTNWYYGTSAYDVNPLIGTTAMPGYLELAALYNQYRVHSIHLKFEGSNMHTSPVVLSIWPSFEVQTHNALTNINIIEYGGAYKGIRQVISPSGGMDRISCHKKYTLTELVVNHSWLGDSNYTATVTSNPTTMWNVNMGIAATVGTLTTNGGIQGIFSVALDVEFFDRKTLLS
jgi:hypothetical protein